MHGHNDLIALNEEERELLCRQIREFLVSKVSRTGGHLASNLGVVELTLAIETVFDTSKDRLVFDVGHQSYVHKLLTGRQSEFDTLRQFGGMAGFPKPTESNTDAFVAGHSSSSVSIALGMARARTLTNSDYHVVALLGDGAATGGMVYEGLNDAAVSNEPLIVILNDNELSIDRNVGGMASHLSKLRTKEKYLGMKEKYRKFLTRLPGGGFIFRVTRNIKDRVRRMLIPQTIFESMGFTYLGPIDGHDTENLISLLKIAKDMKRPVLLHVMTQKGKGYAPAEEHPKLFHGVGKFNPKTGEVPGKGGESFSDAFGKAMCALAEKDSRVCAITAAMPGGTGLLEFKKEFPDRLFDVGIAEEHAMSMAGGLAKQGMIPVIALYSTFLQRAYDMILQDICMLKLHVVLAVDRAGLVGEDGETHHGVFDVGFLRQALGMTVLCPASIAELGDMLQWAALSFDGPVAVRYPRGGDRGYTESVWQGDLEKTLHCHRQGKDVTIIAYGTMINNALDTAQELSARGIQATVLRLLCVSSLPVKEIVSNMSDSHNIVIMEETCHGSGICQDLSYELHRICPDCRIIGIDLGDGYVTHGAVDALYRHCGLDGKTAAEHIQEVLQLEN
ncbi:MAG: 1-deoxy-D-xylulose-5-phosphate synthase [Oscillospiraceae bacterium]|nr:1-deoxy-D-xylulose-5-phosphate synthase [Oscillospiraceae bacterium]